MHLVWVIPSLCAAKNFPSHEVCTKTYTIIFVAMSWHTCSFFFSFRSTTKSISSIMRIIRLHTVFSRFHYHFYWLEIALSCIVNIWWKFIEMEWLRKPLHTNGVRYTRTYKTLLDTHTIGPIYEHYQNEHISLPQISGELLFLLNM